MISPFLGWLGLGRTTFLLLPLSCELSGESRTVCIKQGAPRSSESPLFSDCSTESLETFLGSWPAVLTSSCFLFLWLCFKCLDVSPSWRAFLPLRFSIFFSAFTLSFWSFSDQSNRQFWFRTDDGKWNAAFRQYHTNVFGWLLTQPNSNSAFAHKYNQLQFRNECFTKIYSVDNFITQLATKLQ